MSKKKKQIGIHELYAQDPIEADRLVWGRETDPASRRGFIKKSALAAMSMVLGAKMVFAENFPAGLIPAGLAESDQPFAFPGKHPDLIVLNDKPINLETPAHLLDDKITPADKFFVRNNGNPPNEATIDPKKWTLTIEGESVRAKKTYTLEQLKSKFKHYTYQLTLECGGNGRKEFSPSTKGLQWTVGAIGCAKWTGVRLKDVLNDVGIKNDAVYIGYYGKDTHLNGSNDVVISRGVPIDKAMQDESLIAWAMNDKDIPLLNGHPLRLIFGGWPASTSGKWLHKIVVRNKVHDGAKMSGHSYRVPCNPIAPGEEVDDKDMCIIEAMPVRSVITYPKSGATIKLGQKLPIRGHAWAGDLAIREVQYSIDFGQTWKTCTLEKPANRNAWQHFSASVDFPKKGYYEVWAKATDENGVSQPMVIPSWNPGGYLNNACHRIAVKIA